jgi:hypothetical protein
MQYINNVIAFVMFIWALPFYLMRKNFHIEIHGKIDEILITNTKFLILKKNGVYIIKDDMEQDDLIGLQYNNVKYMLNCEKIYTRYILVTLGVFNIIVKLQIQSGRVFLKIQPTYYSRDLGISFLFNILENIPILGRLVHYILKLLIFLSHYERNYDRVANLAVKYLENIRIIASMTNIEEKQFTVTEVINHYLLLSQTMKRIIEKFNENELPPKRFESFCMNYSEKIMMNNHKTINKNIINNIYYNENKEILVSFNEKPNEFLNKYVNDDIKYCFIYDNNNSKKYIKIFIYILVSLLANFIIIKFNVLSKLDSIITRLYN